MFSLTAKSQRGGSAWPIGSDSRSFGFKMVKMTVEVDKCSNFLPTFTSWHCSRKIQHVVSGPSLEGAN